MSVSFSITKIKDDRTGQDVDAIVKTTTTFKYGDTDSTIDNEVWCTIPELDRLFDTCVRRWGSNWDLEKVLTAIREADFE